ncbi:hypothetical protein [Emticicia sp. 21SJ11W-3]|uniref:hypothetical protein n=1 Tax=Emticicia sp. 21SJ11W-3 TaxID=2916755 RepID=UPI0020A1DAEA|nr:hypothetical protein [Emticicia sp. 21SJ11W-3]UTA66498.1 hypothetical protein MB380_12900 [Emticicia sp. 21SJ11W-3]
MNTTTNVTSGQYLLAPQASTTTVLTLMSGSITLTGNTTSQTSLTLVSPSTGASQAFTITNGSAYAEGIITINYPAANGGAQETAECHINFFLNTTQWEQDSSGSFPDDNTSIIPAKSTGSLPTLLNVTQPTSGPSDGIDSLYQVLNKAMVFLVDYRPEHQTMLFRGNTPFAAPTADNGQQAVDFGSLHTYMENQYISQTGNKDFPAQGSYTLRDVCLQSQESEGQSILWELESFGGTSLNQLNTQTWVPADNSSNTTQNQMCNWQIEPHTQPGNDVFDWDSVKQLSDWMCPKDTNPNFYIYYIHCASGHDRTGIVASAYMIVNRGLSLNHSLIYGTTVAKQSATSGQVYADCQDLDGTNKGNIDPDRSRLMMIANIYDQTVLNIYNSQNNPDPAVTQLPAEAMSTDPAYVYSTYPWD